MSDAVQKVMILNVAIGGWYPRGLARMIQQFREVSPGYDITSWVNCYPPGTPTEAEYPQDGYNYRPYIAKPFAMAYALDQGADIAILLDAAFYPVRDIFPLVEHTAQVGYYLCRNGNMMGEWSSDECLRIMGLSRSQAMAIEEVSSYCVGLNFAHHEVAFDCQTLAQRWALYWRAIPGPHTNECHATERGRNRGFCSKYPKVKGHRHDQSTLSILAHQCGMDKLIARPQFTAYLGQETEETVLVNHGMGS